MWPGAPSGLNQRGPQSALSISFEPLCTLQSVGLQGCLRNRSEKNRLVQTYELRSALTIIRRGSLSASRICHVISKLAEVFDRISKNHFRAPSFGTTRSWRAERQCSSMGWRTYAKLTGARCPSWGDILSPWYLIVLTRMRIARH